MDSKGLTHTLTRCWRIAARRVYAVDRLVVADSTINGIQVEPGHCAIPGIMLTLHGISGGAHRCVLFADCDAILPLGRGVQVEYRRSGVSEEVMAEQLEVGRWKCGGGLGR